MPVPGGRAPEERSSRGVLFIMCFCGICLFLGADVFLFFPASFSVLESVFGGRECGLSSSPLALPCRSVVPVGIRGFVLVH